MGKKKRIRGGLEEEKELRFGDIFTGSDSGQKCSHSTLFLACVASRWDVESNEGIYKRFSMSETSVGVACVVAK